MQVPSPQPDAGPLAVLHPSGEVINALIINSSGTRPSVMVAEKLGPDIDIDAWLAGHDVNHTIAVLPSSAMICRTCTLPVADPAVMTTALDLQVETLLMGNSPVHRLGKAVLPGPDEESIRTGIILSWPRSRPGMFASVNSPLSFTSELVGLAGLVGLQRPAEPHIYVDRRNGSLSIALCHANGVLLRGTSLDQPAHEDWRERVCALLSETAQGVGLSDAFLDPILHRVKETLAGNDTLSASLILPSESTQAACAAVEGAGEDAAWLAQYGIALGVSLAAYSTLATLTMLQDAAIDRPPSLGQRLMGRLSERRMTTAAALVAILAILFVPAIGSSLRLSILEQRFGELEDHKRAIDDVRARLSMFEALEDESFSMTKILSDIMCSTPEGIDLDSIRVSTKDDSFSLTGTVRRHGEREATEIVALMQEQLDHSGLFSRVALDWGDSNAYGHYEFNLTASIRRPHRDASYEVEQDFGRWTLADRKQHVPPPGADDESGTPGRDAKPAPEAPREVVNTPDPDVVIHGTDDDTTSEPNPARTLVGSGSVDDGVSSFSDTSVRTGSGVDPNLIPEPLSEAQINAMTRDEAQANIIEVANAKQRAIRGNDEELTERLSREFSMLLEHLKTFRNE